MQVFVYFILSFAVLLQHGADPNIRNTDGKSALDLADPSAKAVLTGQSRLMCQTNISNKCYVKLSHMPIFMYKCFTRFSNLRVFLVPGEYKKDELLEAARWVCQ